MEKKRRSDGATERRRGGAPRRRGFALIDVLVAGIILSIGLSVILTVTGRSLAIQTNGEKHLVAAWLADELLSQVLVDGPDNYPLLYDTSGGFGPPFSEFTYDVDIENLGRGAPYRVNAVVRWGDRPKEAVQVETLIALRLGDPEQPREPYEEVDREARNFPDEF